MNYLENNPSLLYAIASQTTEGITVADMEGNYLYVNDAFCKMSGYTKEELLKLTVFDMKAKNQNHQSFYDSKEEYEGVALRVNLERKDGSEYLTEIIGDVIEVDGKKQVLGTIRDISARVKAEMRIHELNKSLESKVEERTEALNQTIQDLNQEIEQRTKIENKLKESLEVKQLLLNEVTHRVKNNLQVISSILNMQRRKDICHEAKMVCEETSNRIQSMALIHESLYKAQEFNQVKFDDYIFSLVEYLKNVFAVDHIEFKQMVEPIIFSFDTASCCGMIALELITNSIKYAFPDDQVTQPVVDLQLNKTEDGYEFTVADNGIGLPCNFNPSESETLGMQLTSSLVEQLEGELKIDTSNGVKFTIHFKDNGREFKSN